MAAMRIPFTKMQGAGNDFVVIDETRVHWGLTPAHYRWLGDRHFGVGADQILTVRACADPGLDFEYLIHNADGQEVEQCGNGARCFARFVHEQGLSDQSVLRVKTKKGIIYPRLEADGNVTVDMGQPHFAPSAMGFDPALCALQSPTQEGYWPLQWQHQGAEVQALVATVSMGNPHAVLQVAAVDTAPVASLGPQIQQLACFTEGVNVGFMQIVDRGHIRLRVFERGVGETLACGSGACAAVVAGIRLGLLDAQVQVQARGGLLRIAWAGTAQDGAHAVWMTGPARTVFQGEIDFPENLGL
jgi:diaminopimelate epimerase